MNIFSERIKELRLENNLTQDALALKTGISQSAIANWENGKKSPSIESIVILAKFFKCSSDYLLGLED
ncbi:MAG: helix-turn-helix transcriptional regulator [Clostridiales bacterium]|nr:helix-turn-helix transcriptional regulator [Clostridiales bacterium]